MAANIVQEILKACGKKKKVDTWNTMYLKSGVCRAGALPECESVPVFPSLGDAGTPLVEAAQKTIKEATGLDIDVGAFTVFAHPGDAAFAALKGLMGAPAAQAPGTAARDDTPGDRESPGKRARLSPPPDVSVHVVQRSPLGAGAAPTLASMKESVARVVASPRERSPPPPPPTSAPPRTPSAPRGAVPSFALMRPGRGAKRGRNGSVPRSVYQRGPQAPGSNMKTPLAFSKI